MKDNKTSQAAIDYDANVNKTIPLYHMFHDETLALVKEAISKPQSWLDTGCGTGTLLEKIIKEFGQLRIVAADPAEEMLKITAEKLKESEITYVLSGSEVLDYPEKFDVVTAIMAHHYLDEEGRRKGTQNCFNMLRQGGIYVTFETIKPNTEAAIQIGLKRWRTAQIRNGKRPDAVDKHISRYGSELLPITIEAHRKLLSETGFSTVEVFWVSGMQAGFYGIK
ncbi:class I SAM-dependent methyltransferase [Sporomusa sp. KB1]|jgi:tRNA (cmo5U34)-methyltransferase|uniref:class I SAM-dependent methyltransferase n=1 Tax=Sporomusa sp. KB1 TaxID=943346 RepID=UPI0011A2F95B|nr:class I SAM-dependent methyltransferase [Sporomusa sp. KB1]TWH48078.1 tRNA (cmo5U34)-methyltransferase [Sporomusa sp. KB1]